MSTPPSGGLCAIHRRAFVTGASAGLGFCFCEMLLSEGIEVWGTSRSLDRLRGLEERYPARASAQAEGGALAGAGGVFHPVALDLGEPNAACAAFSQAWEEAGGFDLVVLNAGSGVFGSFGSVSREAWLGQLGAMVGGTAALAHASFPRLLSLGKPCSLVIVSSLATEFPIPFMTGYNMAKAAQSALATSLADEARGSSLRVLDFRPGDHRTGFNVAMAGTGSARVESLSAREAAVWRRLEEELREAPMPECAAQDLRRALLRRRSGVFRSGSLFQAKIAPFFAALAPAPLMCAVRALHFRDRP